MTEEELLKRNYIEELDSADIKDKDLVQNLKYMMNMGYLNYKINYNLLTRNNNDLIIAINKLCNNLVSDSMFEVNHLQKWKTSIFKINSQRWILIPKNFKYNLF